MGNTNKIYKTKYGNSIQFVDGYMDAHKDLFINSVAKPDDIINAEKINYKGWVNDLFTYSMMVDMFDEFGIECKFNRSLDIGGAQGVLSRLMKAEGKTKWAACIEIRDMQNSINQFVFYKHYIKYRIRLLLSSFNKLKMLAPGNNNKYGYFIKYRKNHAAKYRVKKLPSIDDYIVGDVFQHNEKYDLITSIQSLGYFDLDEIFKKISELLEDGGVFFVLVDYFWYPVNSTRIVGDAPYMAQRLDEDDLLRYFSEFHPEMAASVKEKLSYCHKGNRPVISDFIKTADKYNLQLINCRRHTTPMQDSNIRTRYTPTFIDKHKNTKLTDILCDIKQYNSNVEIEDLQTTHISIAFRKINRNSTFKVDRNKKDKTLGGKVSFVEKIGRKLLG